MVLYSLNNPPARRGAKAAHLMLLVTAVRMNMVMSMKLRNVNLVHQIVANATTTGRQKYSVGIAMKVMGNYTELRLV